MLKCLLERSFAVLMLTAFITGLLATVTGSLKGEKSPRQVLLESISVGLLYSGDAEAADVLPQKKYLKPEEAFIPSLTQDNDRLKITFEIADGYYLYQEKLKIEARNCTLKEIIIPEGIPHDDEYMGQSHIFFSRLEIEAGLLSTSPLPQLLVTYQGCTEGLCYPPRTATLNLRKISAPSDPSQSDSGITSAHSQKDTAPDNTVSGNTDRNYSTDNASEIYEKIRNSGFIAGLLIFFVLGLLMSLTPCMFPMYPIWSAIIIGGHKKNFITAFWYSFLYIQGMALTYMLIGFGIAFAGTKLHAAIQHPLMLICLSLVFIVLAASMFGLFELPLPEKIVRRLQGWSDKQKGGTLAGVFAMGVLSAVIASPCTTAPLAGALMFIMQDGSLLKGGLYLYIMALGMGTPLFIVGLCGQKYLPRTGNWTVIIKVICGFLLLSVPLILLQRYLSAGTLTALSVLLITAMIAYLAYALPKTHKKVFTGITALCGIVLAFTGWLMTDAEPQSQIFSEIKTPEEFHRILKSNETVILDFRADWCRTCIMYEKTTFQDPQVRETLLRATPVFADITTEDAPAHQLLEEYAVTGVPAILIFKDGKLSKKITGYKNAAEFLTEIGE